MTHAPTPSGLLCGLFPLIKSVRTDEFLGRRWSAKHGTLNTYIYNQTLYVRLSNPALRADLSLMREEFVKKLNAAVGQQVIADVRFG